MMNKDSSGNHDVTLRGFADASLIVTVSILTAIVAERAITWGEQSSFGVIGGSLIAALTIVAWFYAFFKPIKRLIGTPHFAVTIVLFISAATALGTFIKQNAADAYYRDVFGTFGSRIIDFTGLWDVFHSWWYVGLYLLLAGSLIVVSLARKFSRENISFHLSHLSLIVILLGVWLDFFVGMRGIMHMEVGTESNVVNTFLRNTNYLTGQKELDFTLRLDQFESQKFEPDFKIQIWKMRQGQNPEIVAAVPVDKNTRQGIHSTDVSFEVVDYFPNHSWDYEAAIPVENMSPNDPILIARVKSERGEETIQLRANYNQYNSITDPYNQSNIEFTWTLNDRHKEMLEGNQNISPHALRLIDETGNESSIEVMIGSRYSIPGTDYRLQVRRFYDNLVYDEAHNQYSNRPDAGSNPAIEVDLIGGRQPLKFYLYSNFHGHESTEIAQARLLTGYDFHYDYQSGNGMLIVGDEESIYHISTEEVRKEDLQIGYPYLFEGRLDAYFLVTHIFPDAAHVSSIPINLNDDAVNPLAAVKVNMPGEEPFTQYLVPARGNREALLMIEGYPYFLALESTREQETKFWKSHVAFVDENGSILKAGIIQVNEPIKYGGYRFYQTDFDPQRPTYSGIGVSREPGLGIIYIGFAMLVVGVFMMFYMREPAIKTENVKFPLT